MRERPILMSGPMVRAILAGAKTQTRRVVKNTLGVCAACWSEAVPHNAEAFEDDLKHIAPYLRVPYCDHNEAMGHRLVPRFGEPGDRLWVKETFRVDDFDPAETIYVADVPADVIEDTRGIIKLTPSIFMPRKRSRITLEVVAVRVERLHDISEADAKAEGVGPEFEVDIATFVRGRSLPESTSVLGYKHLWNAINGRGSWASNPWVWVVEFRRVSAGGRAE